MCLRLYVLPHNQQPKARAPEDAIPDKPENRNAREFLKSAPSKGLWLPMGVSVKVMQCWRCKAFGHRTGDRECPMATAGNLLLDAERQAREDPMAKYVGIPVQREMTNAEKKQAKREQLAGLLEEVRREAAEKKKMKKKKRMKSGKSAKSSTHAVLDLGLPRPRHIHQVATASHPNRALGDAEERAKEAVEAVDTDEGREIAALIKGNDRGLTEINITKRE